MEKELENVIDKLSPLERQIIPHLNSKVPEIIEKSGLDSTSVLRALQFLSNKGVIVFTKQEKTIIDLGTNGIYYKKHHLPERKLLILLDSNNHLPLDEAKKLSKLSDNEFKVSLGVLKSKALINLSNGKLSLTASKEELIKKSPEELFLEKLPTEEEKLEDLDRYALENLKKRKEIVEIKRTGIIMEIL